LRVDVGVRERVPRVAIPSATVNKDGATAATVGLGQFNASAGVLTAVEVQLPSDRTQTLSGGGNGFNVFLNTATLGSFTAQYILNLWDADVGASSSRSNYQLTLHLNGNVAPVPVPAAVWLVRLGAGGHGQHRPPSKPRCRVTHYLRDATTRRIPHIPIPCARSSRHEANPAGLRDLPDGTDPTMVWCLTSVKLQGRGSQSIASPSSRSLCRVYRLGVRAARPHLGVGNEFAVLTLQRKC
jgi:hypothetical protein